MKDWTEFCVDTGEKFKEENGIISLSEHGITFHKNDIVKIGELAEYVRDGETLGDVSKAPEVLTEEALANMDVTYFESEDEVGVTYLVDGDYWKDDNVIMLSVVKYKDGKKVHSEDLDWIGELSKIAELM